MIGITNITNSRNLQYYYFWSNPDVPNCTQTGLFDMSAPGKGQCFALIQTSFYGTTGPNNKTSILTLYYNNAQKANSTKAIPTNSWFTNSLLTMLNTEPNAPISVVTLHTHGETVTSFNRLHLLYVSS